MEFNFLIHDIINLDSEGFAVFDSKFCAPNSHFKYNKSPNILQRVTKHTSNAKEAESKFADIINRMGEASAIAQNLKQIITNYDRLMTNEDRLFIKADGNKVLGILKTGPKYLFYRGLEGEVLEVSPVCVLDFYCHESVQRKGIGKSLFEKMLQYEQKQPRQLAYDRPSPKLIAFLKKYYNLIKFVQQNNNYVIFDDYFLDGKPLQNHNLYGNKDYFRQKKEPKSKDFANIGQNIISSPTIIQTEPANQLPQQVQQQSTSYYNLYSGNVVKQQNQTFTNIYSQNIQNQSQKPPIQLGNNYRTATNIMNPKDDQNQKNLDTDKVNSTLDEKMFQQDKSNGQKYKLKENSDPIDEIQKKINQTEKELQLVNQQINQLQLENKAQGKLPDLPAYNIKSQKPTISTYNYFNTYQTTSSQYGKLPYQSQQYYNRKF